MPGKEVLYGIRKHFDEVSFEECAFCIKGSSLRSKVVFVVICTGGKGLSDFCKSSSTAVEGGDFYVKESMVYVCIVECIDGFRKFLLRKLKRHRLQMTEEILLTEVRYLRLPSTYHRQNMWDMMRAVWQGLLWRNAKPQE